MESDSKIINSFYLQDELNPDIWYLPKEKHMGDPDAQKEKLKPEVRARLLKVSEISLVPPIEAGTLQTSRPIVWNLFSIFNQRSSLFIRDIQKQLFLLKIKLLIIINKFIL